ncbi:MAG: hypothetical protein QW578_05085 [Thermoplasmatales archaeon]
MPSPATGRGDERKEEIDNLKRMISEQTLVINAFKKKGYKEGQDDCS